MEYIMDHMLWVEKYRPNKIEDCILPETIKKTFQDFADRKEIPNLLLSGGAGVGKTTVAKALCNEVGCDYLVINGSDERGIAVMQTTVKNYATSMSLTGGRKVIIIDEADNLTTDAQKALRGMIEEVSINCSFIFTCNFKNKIMTPIHSRCTSIDFKLNGSKQKVAAAFFKRVEYILHSEKVEFNREVVANIITKYFPDNRKVINELQRYSVSGSIDVGVLGSVSDINISDLIKSMKEKNMSNARKWVVNNIDNDTSSMLRKLYDALFDIVKPNCVPQMILTIGTWQYRSAFSADNEIVMMSCVSELMVEMEFK
jgi:DNA polymerase III delta prime subunit